MVGGGLEGWNIRRFIHSNRGYTVLARGHRYPRLEWISAVIFIPTVVETCGCKHANLVRRRRAYKLCAHRAAPFQILVQFGVLRRGMRTKK